MDIITNSSKTKYQTSQIDLLLPINTMETAFDIHCSFIPDKIIVRNIYFENSSTNDDAILLMKSDLFDCTSKYSIALHKELKFQNCNLTFPNVKDVNQTFDFQFKGINDSSVHDAAINVVLSIEFIKN